MKLVGIMPARNEDWIIGLSARVALSWVDQLIVLNHASTDGTAEILAEVQKESGRLVILEEPEPVWREMAHRQRLLEAARGLGATHIALVDADEVLAGDTLGFARQYTEGLQPGRFLLLPFRAMWRSPFHYRTDPENVFSHARMPFSFADAPKLCWQAAGGYDFHHREPYGSRVELILRRVGGVMHLQFSDWRRIIAKHALYKMTEVLRWPNRRPAREVDAQYNFTLREQGLLTTPAPEAWWRPYQPWLKYLHLDREPWQAAECRRLWAEHGAARFAGLDLFGVPNEDAHAA